MATPLRAAEVSDEWVEWHRGYDGDTNQARRLATVVRFIRQALEDARPGPIRVISMCAGDGRDLLEAVSAHPRAGDVQARLVEQDPELVRRGRAHLSQAITPKIEFVQGDATCTDTYEGAVPADVILVCGVFGNVTDEDVRNTISHLAELAAPGAAIVWTRGRFEPDLTPSIRAWFRESGFDELSFVPVPGSTASVGMHRLTTAPRPFRPEVRLFTFLPKAERPSQRKHTSTA